MIKVLIRVQRCSLFWLNARQHEMRPRPGQIKSTQGKVRASQCKIKVIQYVDFQCKCRCKPGPQPILYIQSSIPAPSNLSLIAQHLMLFLSCSMVQSHYDVSKVCFIDIDYIMDYYHWINVSLSSIIHTDIIFFINNITINMNINLF